MKRTITSKKSTPQQNKNKLAKGNLSKLTPQTNKISAWVIKTETPICSIGVAFDRESDKENETPLPF